MRMILQIIISNGILDLVTGILAKISLELGFGPNLGWELGFGTPLHDPLYYYDFHNSAYLHFTYTLSYIETVSTGSGRHRNSSRSDRTLGGRTVIGHFKEENRSQLSSRGDRGVSRSIKTF